MSNIVVNQANIAKMLKIPVYTTTQRNSLTGVTEAEIIYNSTESKIQFYDGTQWVTVSNLPFFESPLTTQPDFLGFYSTRSATFRGFDSSGMFITGDANSTYSYPIRTNNLLMSGSIGFRMRYTLNKNNVCSDHGFCIFRSGQDPVWNWGTNTTRHAVQWNCNTPYMYPASGASTFIANISTLAFYSQEAIFRPTSNEMQITIWTGDNVYSGTPIITTTASNFNLGNISGWTSSSTYEIGFDADQDNSTIRSYFKDLSIEFGSF